MRSLLLATVLLAASFLPVVDAHIDRTSDDRCPPNDIRWWFDHWHRTCCTPSFWCVVETDLERYASPVLP